MKRYTGAILGGVLALAVALVCVRLGFWQLDRLEQRRALNAAYSQALAQPPLDLDRLGTTALSRRSDEFLYHRAVAQGRFEHDKEVLLRGRSHDGRPGVHLVTPLRLESGDGIILVNRGWLPSPDAATVDPRPYHLEGWQTVTGILQRVPDAGDEAAPVRVEIDGISVPSFRRLDRQSVSSLLGEELPELYLQVTPVAGTGSGLPVPIPEPAFDEGSHLGYAIQWFSFAAIAVFGFLVTVVVRRGRPPSRTPSRNRPA